MTTATADPATASPKAGEEGKGTPEVLTADKLYDAAFTAHEAAQANPDDETLKEAAKQAMIKARESYAAERKPPAAKVAPEKYDLKLPEGSKLDAKHIEKIAADAKARGLSQEDAQALLGITGEFSGQKTFDTEPGR